MPGKPSIGFIGLGIMGKPMAVNILKAGFPLSVYNRTKEKMKPLAEAGAHACEDNTELASRSEVIITMLPDSPQVEEVVLGREGLFSHLKDGCTIIDMSSIAPLVSQKIADKLAEKNVHFMDAPVSGGETAAIEGKLAVMAGGDEDLFQKYLPIFEAVGSRVVLVGPVGSGNFTKLVNQIIVAVNIATVGEAFTLAQRAGLDTERVYQAIRAGLAGSKVLDTKIPTILERNFEPGFKLKLHHKDLQNVLETGRNLDIPLPLTSLVQQYITSLVAFGKGELDHGAIVQFTEKISGIEIRNEAG